MSIRVRIVESEHSVVSQYSDTIVYGEFSAGYEPAYQKVVNWPFVVKICDMTAVTAMEVTPQYLREIARRNAEWLSRNGIRGRKLIIAPTDLTFAMARVYYAQASFSALETIHVVRDFCEGAEWLGLDEARLRAYFENVQWDTDVSGS